MQNITEQLGKNFSPEKALLVYSNNGNRYEKDFYIESYDIDDSGYPVNAHPLSALECRSLAKALDSSGELRRSFLKSEGLLPKEVLFIDPSQTGYAVWYSPAQKVHLFFRDDLGIPCGCAYVPPLVWKANRTKLHLFALKSDLGLTLGSKLYKAPFFNISDNGKVCMGNVKIEIAPDCSLEGFMASWQKYFMGSYFTHLLGSGSPVKGNIVQLWQSLIGTGKKFPVRVLVENGLTLKNIIR